MRPFRSFRLFTPTTPTSRLWIVILGLTVGLGACDGRNSSNPDSGPAPDSQHLDQYVADQSPDPDAGPPDAMPDLVAADVGPDGPPPSHDQCAYAKTVTLVDGKATVAGDLQGYQNEYGTAINCGDIKTVLSGPQLYYAFALTAGKSYRFALSNQQAPLSMVLFSSCGATTINQDCSSGKTGAFTQLYGPPNQSLFFTPPTTGTYRLAIEGTPNKPGFDTFTLNVEEFSPPQNGSCAAAKQLVVPAGGTVSAKGSTLGAANEFGTGVNCGQFSTFPAGQVYYKATLTAGKTYLVKLVADPTDPNWQYAAALYLFGASCDAAAINADCGSQGATGALAAISPPPALPGELRIVFKPQTTGTYHLVVDSHQPGSGGAFELTVEDFTPPQNGTCATAQALTLTNGSASVTGDTFGASNEFGTSINCGITAAFTAPQLYYSWQADAGKTYKVELVSSAFDAQFYIFSDTCDAATINSDCASKGVSGDLGAGGPNPLPMQSVLFTPTTAGTYKIAVDGRGVGSNAFTLSVSEYTPPTNTTCATSQALTLTNGKVAVKGDSSNVANEFADQITCNQYPGAFSGPQLYYHATLDQSKTYRLQVSASFFGKLMIFGDSCLAAQINASCGSQGASGLVVDTPLLQPTSVFFKPPTTGIYKIAMESDAKAGFGGGSFDLELSEFVPPTNGSCASAQTVTLASGSPTKITGDTAGVPNEFGSSINCGNISTIFWGNQLYYKVALTAGQTYTFSLEATWGPALLYLFSDTCDAATINADCSSAGVTGAVSGPSKPPMAAVLTFTPQTSGNYIVAVDSVDAGSGAPPPYGPFGPFTLTIN